MEEQIRFSIIIPLYNKERHVERCLNSVFAQTYSNFEIIVVDDGSTDASVSIVNEISRNHDIKLLHQVNSGVSSARNFGIREAKYDYIAFLDSDDAWKPKFLETIMRLIKKFPEAGAYATDYDIIRREGRKYMPRHKHIPFDETGVLIPNYFKSMIYSEPMITSSSVCIKKTVFEKAGMFPEEERLGEDKDMWSRIALVYPIAFSWYIGATYFENADNRTCLKYIPNYERYFIRTLQKKLDNYEVPEAMKNDVVRYISKNLVMLAAKNIKTGNPKFAKKILRDKRCNKFYMRKVFWTTMAVIPYAFLSLLIKCFKYLRDYPVFYMLSFFKAENVTDIKQER